MGEGNGEAVDVEAGRATSSSAAAAESSSAMTKKSGTLKISSRTEAGGEENKRIPKWVPIAAAVVLVTVTLAAVIPVAVQNSRSRQRQNEADLFQSRTGELLLAEPLKGAEWRTASFTPAPPASRSLDSVS